MARTITSIVVLALIWACPTLGMFQVSEGRQGNRTLVILGQQSMVTSHSRFLDLLRAGHSVDVHMAEGSSVALKRFGEWQYDNLVLMAPRHEEPCGLLVDDVVEFMDGGGSLLLVTSHYVSTFSQDLAGECGIEFDAPGSMVVDHVSYHPTLGSEGDHTWIVAKAVVDAPHIVGSTVPGDRVLFHGVGQAFDPDNVLAFSVLSGLPTTYSAFLDQPLEEYPQSAGEETLLVTGVQARNNARALFAGSLFMFSDAALAAIAATPADSHKNDGGVPSANAKFTAGVLDWVFQRSGVIRITHVQHSRADGTPPDRQLQNKEAHNDVAASMFPEPEVAPATQLYRVGDNVTYRVDVEVLDSGTWKGFVADDLQLEFVMLDPYVRTFLQPLGNGTFVATFRVPDQFGVFKFRLWYQRPGYSTLRRSDQVAVRPRRHTEREDWGPAGYPYYAALAAVMAAFFVFSVAFSTVVEPDHRAKGRRE